LANICPDLPGERLTDSSIFKSITGCDRITGELKYRNSFEFTPFVRLLFSANQLPSSRDASSAYFDRWVIVPLENSFRNTEREIPRAVLDASLADSMELSGALNHALEALRGVRRRGKFSETKASQGEVASWRQSTDPCWQWLDTETAPCPSGYVAQDRLYTAYAQSCLSANRPLITRQMFGRKVKQWRPDIGEFQRLVEGRRCWVYAGITLKRPNGDGNSNHSMGAISCSGSPG
jgi:putative DNA primase/helicase